jgi:hypothetical protein
MKKLLAIAFLGTALVGCDRVSDNNGIDRGNTGTDRDNRDSQPSPQNQTNNSVPTTPNPGAPGTAPR